jgi:outer membrane protein assembly factor BamA
LRALGAPAAILVGAGVLVALGAGPALAMGEAITDVRILDNQRTEEATVRSIAGISIGDTLEPDTLDRVREHLNTSGLFADVNVWWEPHGEGVRVNIAVKDKFPWAPLPTFSWSANNKSFGLVFVHGNVFGRGKQLLLGGRIATVDSGATIVYRDPAMFGSWVYYQVQGLVQRQVIPEYFTTPTLADPMEFRETRLFSYGLEAALGVAWMRRVRTQIGWHLERFTLDDGSDNPVMTSMPLVQATNPGTIGVGRASLTFDFRAREFSVMQGTALSLAFDYASPSFDSSFTYWRGGASWEHGIRFFRSHNLIYFVNASAGHNLPFWTENNAGGNNLRGYLVQQFRGDTQFGGKVEYHFPLFSIKTLDFRALVFYDLAAVWFRDLPNDPANIVTDPATGQVYFKRPTPDGRTFPVELQSGFHLNDIHDTVGVGLRFFLRSVAVPLVGTDFGYGVEARNWRFILIVGA